MSIRLIASVPTLPVFILIRARPDPGLTRTINRRTAWAGVVRLRLRLVIWLLVIVAVVMAARIGHRHRFSIKAI